MWRRISRTCAKPFRRYQVGPVWRNEKPGPGRFREFTQFDADTVGSNSPAADAELLMMVCDALEALGLKRGDYVVKVNSRKIAGRRSGSCRHRTGDSRAARHRLRAIDKLDRLGLEGVQRLLGEGRKDESGDFTKGAGLTDEQASNSCSCCVRDATTEIRIAAPVDIAGGIPVPCARRGVNELEAIDEIARWLRLWPRSHLFDTGDHPRSRLLHRPGVRGAADFPRHQRSGRDGGVRLGRGRRAL